MKSKVEVNNEKFIDSDMLLDNAPVDSDDYRVEAQILDAQIKKEGVNNVAVVAPYGAGKSSAITTYLKRYRKSRCGKSKYIQISLADFNQDDEKTQSDYSENAIERSILQQLLYSQKKHKLPNSTLNRTNKTRLGVFLWYSILAMVFLFSTIALIFETSGNSIFYNWKYATPIASCLAIVSIVCFVMGLVHAGKLRKIKYKDLEVSLDKDGKPQGEISLINKFIDEVLYFFECINMDLVIFEDLDRFENLKIFVKLRELNTIINNSPIKAKKVTFVYAVKDTMFKDENQRAKFFEFILPVVPIINPVTTADQIRDINERLANKDETLKLSEQFIKDISFFVDDMRVLKNAFNDYVMMANKLANNNEKRFIKKRENLFAIALYKNLYPYDYARLQKNEGLVPWCIDKKRLLESFVQTKKDEIDKLEIEKEKIRKENINNFEELKLIFKGQHCTLRHDAYAPSITNVDSIDSFAGLTQLAHPTTNGYSVTIRKLPSGETYYERELIIKSRNANRIAAIDDEISSLKQEIESEENDKFSNLINRIGTDNYFSDENVRVILDEYWDEIAEDVETSTDDNWHQVYEDKYLLQQFNFVRLLICKNYIDEDYLEYISNYCSEITVKDMEFIRNVKRGFTQSYSYKLDNVESVIKNLNEEDFSHSAVLVKDILKSLDTIAELDAKDVIKTNKFGVLMRLLSSGKASVVKAITEFLALVDDTEKKVFADIIVQHAAVQVQYLFEHDISDKDKDIFVNALIKHKKYEELRSDMIKSYIEQHAYYLHLLGDIDYDSIVLFIENVKIRFAEIDLGNDRDALYDFIVRGNYYQLNIKNLKVVMNVDVGENTEFEQTNYSYVCNGNNDFVRDRIDRNINEYVEQIYLKLPQSHEHENIVKGLLINEQIGLDNKNRIVEHTDFEMEDFDAVDVQLYLSLLKWNRIKAKWNNVATAYKAVGFGEELIEYFTLNEGNIYGSFSSLDASLQTELFNELIEVPFEEKIAENIANSIDGKFKMTVHYGRCKNIKPFILAGLFDFDINDMQFLSNPPSTMPYLVWYQNKILEQMKDFFGDRQFKSMTGENIIDEKALSLNFKKHFWNLYGNNIDIKGIESKVAKFIIANDCNISEDTLYKFTNVSLDQSLKLALLSLAIKQNRISNLSMYREYFSSIGEEYSRFIKQGEKFTVESDIFHRSIAQFMKANGICDYSQRKEKIYLRIS